MDTVTTADGLALRLQRWPLAGAAGVTARGTVQIVHGLGEHIGRYAGLAAALNAAGWHVAGHDQRGHGRSEGERGDIARPHALLHDLTLVTDCLRGRGRHVMLGHSLGGLVAARWAAEATAAAPAAWARPVDALVLSSPAFDVGLGAGRKVLLRLLARVVPHLRVGNGLRPQWVSRDAAVVRRYIDDPWVHGCVTPATVRFIVVEGARVAAAAARWQVPTLLLWAGSDRCVVPAGSAAFAAVAPAGVVTAHAYPGLFHEIFNEPERALVIGRLTAWLARF